MCMWIRMNNITFFLWGTMIVFVAESMIFANFKKSENKC